MVVTFRNLFNSALRAELQFPSLWAIIDRSSSVWREYQIAIFGSVMAPLNHLEWSFHRPNSGERCIVRERQSIDVTTQRTVSSTGTKRVVINVGTIRWLLPPRRSLARLTALTRYGQNEFDLEFTRCISISTAPAQRDAFDVTGHGRTLDHVRRRDCFDHKERLSDCRSVRDW